MTVLTVFQRCVQAIRDGVLIQRESNKDKEFHFQNWFSKRLQETAFPFEVGGRNSYPDFRLVQFAEGYELKGLAYPRRDASFDSNSQIPSGFHNGRTIYYVFGRYPKEPDGNSYPVLDLVFCQGDFLNADREYLHRNKSVKGFGTYGDITIRDRKMYVVPTPFRLVEGSAHHHTLILPAEMEAGEGLVEVGNLTRKESAELIVGYSFNLQTNEIVPEKALNPGAGREHHFRAWRTHGSPTQQVSMRAIQTEKLELEADDKDADN